jgi:hypothetical protein
MNSKPLAKGTIRLQTSEHEAVVLARGLGCRVLHVSHHGAECRVRVELPDQRAVTAVTTAVIYGGMRYESESASAGTQ